MQAVDIPFLSATELSGLIQLKEISPLEAVDAYLNRIEQVDPSLNSYITVLATEARQAALDAEREITGGGYRGPLHGVPVAVKDQIHSKGIRTTDASKIRSDFLPAEDATVLARLKDAGAILLGKLNMHEFAYGITGEDSAFGACRNPWNYEKIAGGSSSGSGAAVASGLAYGSIGTDTGGSIRIPACLCGIVGFKPSYGRVSRYGVIPLSQTSDHVGPLARSTEDAALMLQVMAGHDPKDSTSSTAPVPDFTEGLRKGIRGLRVGILRDYLSGATDPEVENAVQDAVATLGYLGAELREVSVPLLGDVNLMWDAIVMTEATAYHSRYMKTHSDQYASAVRTRLEAGLLISGVSYLKAKRSRRVLSHQFEEIF